MSDLTTPDQSDRQGLYVTVGAAAIGIVAAVVTTVSRLIEVAPGKDIPVLVALDGEAISLPLGPDGAPVAATADAATVIVADPAAATLFALWAQPIVVGLTWIALLVVAALFCLRLARAQVFTRSTARLLYAGAAILTAGWVLGSLFSNMTSNGALSAISDYSYDSVTFSVNLAAAIGALALAAVGLAVQLGERLQRETDGLV
jgi:hypothetical protein